MSSNDEIERREQDLLRLRQMLLDGLNSPLSEEPLDDAYFEKFRERARQAGRKGHIETRETWPPTEDA